MRGALLVVTLAGAAIAVTTLILHRGSRTGEARATRPHPETRSSVAPDVPQPDSPVIPVAATDSISTTRLSIDGEVLDVADGRPIAQATVYALMDSNVVAEAKADGLGAFSLDVPEKRRYALAAAAAEHVPSQIQACWTRNALEAEPGDRVRIALERALRIRGTVEDQAGRGLAGAMLESTSYYFEWEKGSVVYGVGPTASALARTDAFGRFEISDVPPRGRTTFFVTLDGYSDGRLRVDAGAMPFPTEYAVRLDALPVFVGRVVAADGRPLAGAAVMPLAGVIDTIATAPAVLTSDAGVFRIPWRARSSSLLVWALGFVPAIVPVRPHDLLRGSPVEVRLEGAAQVRGVVRDDQGLPVEGARVRVHHYEMESGGLRGRLFAPFVAAYSPDPAIRWYLLPRDQSGCFCLPEAVTDAEGSFRLDVAARGDAETVVSVSKEGYVESMVASGEASPAVVGRLVRAARIAITASDARTGTALPRFRIVVVNPDAPMVDRSNPGTGQPVAAFVAPGTMRITVEAEGYEKNVVEIDLSAGAEFCRSVALDPK